MILYHCFRFKANALRIQKLILTKPVNAERRLQTSVRFLIENGGQLPELQPYSIHLNAVQFYNLDLMLLFVAFLFLFVFLLKIVLRLLYRFLHFAGKQKTE
jgi:hypothetical protein